MTFSNYTQWHLITGFICLIAFYSCRKKENQYEGNYVGIERHVILDSGETVYSLDTSYHQEIDITYSKNYYHLLKTIPSTKDHDEDFHKNEFVEGKAEYSNFYYSDGAGYLVQFTGDSLHFVLNSKLNSLYQEWNFRGKRN